MRSKIFRITGSGFVKQGSITDGHPVEFRHWKEVVDEADNFLESAVTSEEEQAVVELWLEDPLSFQDADDLRPMGARSSKGSMIRNADIGFGRRQAAVRETNWDSEFADAQAHAASVLSKLGNGR